MTHAETPTVVDHQIRVVAPIVATVVEPQIRGLADMYSPVSIKQSLSSSSCELIILPTEKCNFRCTYCYEDFAIGKMKIETVEAIKKFISARAPSLKFLTLSWFGGEPLLARDVIINIAKHAYGQSKNTASRCTVDSRQMDIFWMKILHVNFHQLTRCHIK